MLSVLDGSTCQTRCAFVKYDMQTTSQSAASLYNQIVYAPYNTAMYTTAGLLRLLRKLTTLNVCRQKQQSIQMQTVRYMYM